MPTKKCHKTGLESSSGAEDTTKMNNKTSPIHMEGSRGPALDPKISSAFSMNLHVKGLYRRSGKMSILVPISVPAGSGWARGDAPQMRQSPPGQGILVLRPFSGAAETSHAFRRLPVQPAISRTCATFQSQRGTPEAAQSRTSRTSAHPQSITANPAGAHGGRVCGV